MRLEKLEAERDFDLAAQAAREAEEAKKRAAEAEKRRAEALKR
jgi:hypothetical protein